MWTITPTLEKSDIKPSWHANEPKKYKTHTYIKVYKFFLNTELTDDSDIQKGSPWSQINPTDDDPEKRWKSLTSSQYTIISYELTIKPLPRKAADELKKMRFSY